MESTPASGPVRGRQRVRRGKTESTPREDREYAEGRQRPLADPALTLVYSPIPGILRRREPVDRHGSDLRRTTQLPGTRVPRTEHRGSPRLWTQARPGAGPRDVGGPLEDHPRRSCREIPRGPGRTCVRSTTRRDRSHRHRRTGTNDDRTPRRAHDTLGSFGHCRAVAVAHAENIPKDQEATRADDVPNYPVHQR